MAARIVSLLAFLVPNIVFAWGSMGHQAIGRIAELQLDPAVAKQVSELLDGESLARSSTWADRIKKDKGWKHQGPYHYLGIPDDKTYLQTVGASSGAQNGDVIMAILEAEQQFLDSSSSLEDQQDALKFIVHYIGDLHQPLHTGRPDDRGGNDVSKDWNGFRSNLHAIWDSLILENGHQEIFQNKNQSPEQKYVDVLLNKYKNAGPEESTIDDIVAWQEETMSIRPEIYKFQKDSESNYTARFIDSVDEQVYFGGVRLGHFINQMFEKQQMPGVRTNLKKAIEKIIGSISDVVSLRPTRGTQNVVPVYR